ncbi:hypothetical protein BT93_H3903 [Corymbia citriodora subsp. variegata]|nr:hypothetical protein BT93_H3903 [Corymbia citriodora subsp. variegata]
MAKNLKVLNLTGCQNLCRTPDVSAHENLEQLILEGCMGLVQVDRSIGKLKQLVLLNLNGCWNLEKFPDEMEELEALTELLVDDTSITNIPEWKGIKKLKTLSAKKCRLLSKCNLAGCSTSLLYLDLSSTRISELPLGNFGSLVELRLTESNIRELPNSIETMKYLRVLDISDTGLEKLPSAMGMLEQLEEIDANNCRCLCGEIPTEIGNLSSLRILRLLNTGISNIPKLPESMTDLYLLGNPHMRCPDLSNLLNLRDLRLELRYQTPSHAAPSLDWIGSLTKLEHLSLLCGGLVTLPSDFNLLSKLRRLELAGNNQERLPRLPQNLSYFEIRGCSTSILNLSYLERLSELEVFDCEQLIEIQGLECLKNLQSLGLEGLPSLVKLLDLTGLNNLWRLWIEHCPKLIEVRGQLESLEYLRLEGCESLERLPDPLSFKHIDELSIGGCGKLEEIQGLEVSENLNVLNVWDLPLLEKLPDLTNAKELKVLKLGRCPRLIEIRGRLNSLKTLFIRGCGSLRQFSDPSSFENLWSFEIEECEGLEEILESDEYGDLKKEMEKPMEPYYEVFLSFRGPDTRRDITDILYNSLIDAGIRAYRDDEELRIGKEIGPELLQSIKQSKISIPIFSKEYAASKWCLMELVQMVECKEKWGQKIMPIFYDVEPSEVRNQTASYGKAIQSHINRQLYTDETIQNWKAALNKVGALKGWELKERYMNLSLCTICKGEFTREVVQKVLIELKKNYLAVPDFLVEMDNHVDRIMELIGEQTAKTNIVGIHGMGGVGKTTLAKIVYNKLLLDSTKCCNLSNSSDEMADEVDRIMEVIGEQTTDSTKCCSLSNIGDMKIESLQNQLISNVLGKKRLTINDIDEGKKVIKELLSSKRVILLLDDVDQKTKLDALVGMGKCWFGSGSKVIITTRNKEVLKDVELKHELIGMDFDHSLQLFSKHAFRSDHPPAEYAPLLEKAVKVCGCLPLALEIIGSFLAGRDRKFWETTLEKLETIPDENVEEKLNISIEALNPHAKEIFLDVCCFFIGFDVKIVRHMWKSCGFLPDYYLDVLQQMSLIKITKRHQLWMHDLLRDIGRHFVRRIGTFRPEMQSRVWDHEQANDVLIAKQGTENVEAMRLKFDHQSQCFFKKEEFASLSNLRFLQVDCGDLDMKNVQRFSLTNWFQRNLSNLPKLRWLSWHKFGQHCPSTKRSQRNLLILPNLRYLSWHEFPTFFWLTAFSLMKIVILDLSRSQITNDWEGWNHLKMAKNLKVLNLTKCRNLHKTPNVSTHENLEQLILQGCKELVQVDRSIGKLKQLVFLNLEGCWKLQTLPDEMEGLEALTELLLDETSITKIPEWKGMKKLETLSASSCGLLRKCNLASCSTSLLYLRLSSTSIRELPFGNFGSLIELNLSHTSIRDLPNSIETMKNLRVLRICRTILRKLPSALGMLEKLEEIEVRNCSYLCGGIPSEIGKLSFLKILTLTRTGISNIPKLPESMTSLYLIHNLQMRCPDLSNLLKLRDLALELKCGTSSHLAPSLNWIGGLRKLESLWLWCDSLVTLPSDFNLLSKLRKLLLNVDNLACLPRLPQNLSDFQIHGRKLMEKSINLSYLENLSKLEVYNCEQLIEIEGLEHMKKLQRLRLVHLPSLVKLPDLTGLKKLKRLWIEDCPKLVDVRGQLESLEELSLQFCESLEKLPDALTFKHIEGLVINGCWKLKEIQGLENSENLSSLYVGDLPLLEKLPDLTNAKELEDLVLVRCPRLAEIPGRLESLERLEIDGCESLQQFSDPSSFKKLENLAIKECEKLEEILESDDYRDLKKVGPTLKEISTFSLFFWFRFFFSPLLSAYIFSHYFLLLPSSSSLISDDPSEKARPEPAATNSDRQKERDGDLEWKHETRFDRVEISLRGLRPLLPARPSVPTSS